jgi:hypothetical protein
MLVRIIAASLIGERGAVGWISRLVGASPLDPGGSRGFCGVALGRSDTRQEVPTRLQVLAGRPLGR